MIFSPFEAQRMETFLKALGIFEAMASSSVENKYSTLDPTYWQA